MHPSVLPVLRNFLGEFEGVCNFMYLDSRGLVTTGIGNLIEPIARSHGYHWLHNGTNAPASTPDVDREWRQIKARQADKERGGMHFRQFTHLHLSDPEVERIFRTRAEGFNHELLGVFPDFEAYPADAQLGMLVHAWACGTGRLRSEWPSYTAACTGRDWVRAGEEAIWRQLRSQREHARRRREAIQNMFHNAANIEAANREGFHMDIRQVHFPALVMEVQHVHGSRPGP